MYFTPACVGEIIPPKPLGDKIVKNIVMIDYRLIAPRSALCPIGGDA